MYIVTGGAGFIGSVIARKLNDAGIDDLVIVDELGSSERWKNLRKINFIEYFDKNKFLELVKNEQLSETPKCIVHMGACSSTTEKNADYMITNNFEYTRILADYAVRNGIRFIYASSAATYGDGSMGYADDVDKLESHIPLNVYGYSKHLFDLYAKRSGYFNDIVGLKFFNVFGPNEYHKEDMRSMAQKSFEQIKSSGTVKLFRSHRSDYTDGEQKRDFIYIKDCVDTVWWLINSADVNGLFNLGSGKARSWNDLVRAVFKAMGTAECIEYIDMPASLRGQYQYFTEAPMAKLREAGCPVKVTPLEDAIGDYVTSYLERGMAHY